MRNHVEYYIIFDMAACGFQISIFVSSRLFYVQCHSFFIHGKLGELLSICANLEQFDLLTGHILHETQVWIDFVSRDQFGKYLIIDLIHICSV